MNYKRIVFSLLFIVCTYAAYSFSLDGNDGQKEIQSRMLDIKKLRDKFPLPVPKATKAEILSAQATIASYGLQRVDERTVTGTSTLRKEELTNAVGREIVKNVRSLAAAAYKGGEKEKTDFYLYLDYLLSENLLCDYPDGNNFYDDWRKIPADLLSALIVCDDVHRKKLIERVHVIISSKDVLEVSSDDFWNNISSDYIYLMLPHLFISALYIPDENEAVRCMEQFSAFLSRCAQYAPGGMDILKPDGTGFHHGTHYNGYMYCYNTWVEYVNRLSGTSFHITREAYLHLRKAIMSIYMMATCSKTDCGHFYGNSMSGRHPFYGNEVSFQSRLFDGFIAAGRDVNNGEDDLELKAFYNYIYKTDKYHEAPKKSFDGFYQFNYSPAGIYRKDNWVAVMRSPTTRAWSSEIYNRTNRMGRYMGHGSLEILYEGRKIESSGYPSDKSKKGAGWDWNVIPGTTTVHYTSWKDMMPNKNDKDRFDQFSLSTNFSGALSLGGCGIWAAAFEQNDCWGRALRFEDTTNLRFCKSVFAFDGVLLALGSGISAQGDYPDKWITATNLFQSVQPAVPEQLVVNGKEMMPGDDVFVSSGKPVWMITPNSTGYYIPKGNNELVVKYGEQESPSGEGKLSKLGKEIAAKAYLNHGRKPADGKYSFMVIPAADTERMQSVIKQQEKGRLFDIVEQGDSLHVVRHLNSKSLAYAFFAPAANLTYGAVRGSDTELLVIERIDKKTGELQLALCNPNLRPMASGKSWVETPTNTVLSLNGKWTIQTSSDINAIVESDEGSNGILKVVLKQGAPVYVTLKKLK